jgi:hypothetical protein
MYTTTWANKHVVEWADSRSRFLASVSTIQDSPPFVRMNLRVPRDSSKFSREENQEDQLHEDLFIELQETLILRPYIPHNSMLVVNPHLYEISVRVDNFWSNSESGGNSGRVARRGTVYVSGDTDALQRLRGAKDARFTSSWSGRGTDRNRRDASGVHGLTHELQGGILIRRMRAADNTRDGDFGQRWVCIDYTATHAFHCPSKPMCIIRAKTGENVISPMCRDRPNLHLVRQSTNAKDTNAIAVVCLADSEQVIGFAPRELAACLSPAIDAFAVKMNGDGVYSKTSPGVGERNRVWFRVVDGTGRDQNQDDRSIQDKLQAISWWVTDDSHTRDVSIRMALQ